MISEAAIDVGTTATLLFSGRGRVVVSTNDFVRLGGSAVTATTGTPLQANSYLEFIFAEDEDLYAIRASGSAVANVLSYPLPAILSLVNP